MLNATFILTTFKIYVQKLVSMGTNYFVPNCSFSLGGKNIVDNEGLPPPLVNNHLYTLCIWTYLFQIMCQQFINNIYLGTPNNKKEAIKDMFHNQVKT